MAFSLFKSCRRACLKRTFLTQNIPHLEYIPHPENKTLSHINNKSVVKLTVSDVIIVSVV